MNNTYIIEYIWIDGDNGLRSKIRCTNTINMDELEWNYDGSSTNQASTSHSEVILKPVKILMNVYENLRFRKDYGIENINNIGVHFLLLCHCVDNNNLAVKNNNYLYAKEIFDNPKVKNSIPWFGLEQEYFIVNPSNNCVVGFDYLNDIIEPREPQGKYYCGFNANHSICRKIAQKHLYACQINGIKISGINAEVAYGQWEFQIGPVEGIEAAYHLWIARYLLLKIAEEEGYSITFEPKPIIFGDWNGSGCHTNFSTKYMRDGNMNENRNGLYYIFDAMQKLEEKHKEHIDVYGTGNELRLTGKHETSDLNKFSYGIGSRNTSVRIGYKTYEDKKGYFEDRRPSSNMDPYLVCAKIAETILI